MFKKGKKKKKKQITQVGLTQSYEALLFSGHTKGGQEDVHPWV